MLWRVSINGRVVQVKATEVGLEDSDVTTVVVLVDDGTYNEGDWAVGGRGRGDYTCTDTIDVGIREGDEEVEAAMDRATRSRVETLLSIVFSRSGS